MALSIKNPEADRLAAEVPRETGETMTRAVIVALEERLQRLRGRRRPPYLVESIMAISKRAAGLPELGSSIC